MAKLSENISLSKEIFELEDLMLKLRTWNDGLEFMVAYFSWRDPDIEDLLEKYNATSALFWAFQRDFELLTNESIDKIEEMMKKNSEKVKELEKTLKKLEI